MCLLYIEMAVKILPHGRQQSTYFAWSISWRAVGRANPVGVFTSVIFLKSFPILAGISDEFYYGGSVSLDMRNGIRGFNFLVKIIKFGTNIGLNMVINISYRFCHKPGKMLAKLLCVFQLCTLKIIVHIHSFSRVISNAARIFNALSFRRVRSWRFCLIKYVHNAWTIWRANQFWHSWAHVSSWSHQIWCKCRTEHVN